MKKICSAIALFTFLFNAVAFCQSNDEALPNAVSKLKTLLNDHPVEKAYLHFDKPYYAAGDTIYFKAYVTAWEHHLLSKISNVLHVDLIGRDNAIMRSILVRLNNGTGWGDFALANNLQKGIYRVRAYTQWMRNNGEVYFFDQPMSVGSINNIAEKASATMAGSPVIGFFPEGGSLVNGITSKLAFKAISADGLGVDVKGFVFSNDGIGVGKFVSAHAGMGAFVFTPEAGKTYKAKLYYANGKEDIVDLPTASDKGIVLAANTDDPNKIIVELRASKSFYQENAGKEFYLMTFCGASAQTVKTKLDNEVLSLELRKNMFTTGILQITLFSPAGEPLSERLAFVKKPDMLNIAVTTDKPIYKPLKKVTLNMGVTAPGDIASAGYFSVSVTDENKVPVNENTEHTILSDLLLTSDLKGYVEQPNYYFANNNKEVNSNLDVLMLTQGFRRFVWKQLLNQPIAESAFQPEKNLEIAGVLKTKSGMPLPGKKVQLTNISNGQLSELTTDQKGRFSFAANFFTGDRILLQTKTSTGKNAGVVTLDMPLMSVAVNNSSIPAEKYNTNADILASLQPDRNDGVVTASNGPANTVSTISKNAAVLKSTRALVPTSSADQVITSEQLRGMTTLSYSLAGIARGIEFSRNSAFIKGTQIISGEQIVQVPMLIIVDGTIANSIDAVPPSTIDNIQIFKGANAGIYGLLGAHGVMVINTKQGGYGSDTANGEASPGIFSIAPIGYYKAREFYSPAYDINRQNNQGADTRTTIFWKSDVVTTADGKASFNYFNASGKGTYRVVIEGIDDKGNLGRQVYRYKVE